VCGENALIYQLAPSVSSVKIDEEGNYSDAVLQVKVTRSDGKTITTPDTLPDGLKITSQLPGDTEKEYAYNSILALSKNQITGNVKFFLYAGDVLIDQETIPILEDGKSVIIADMDNEMDAVACDEDGNVLDGFLPVSTTYKMYAGSQQLALTSLKVDGISGVTATADAETGEVSVTGITKSADATLRIPITGTAYFGGMIYSRTLYFTVNKQICGENAVIYQLLPSVSAVKIDKSGTYIPKTLKCTLRYTNGKTASDTSTLPSGYSMKVSYGSNAALNYTIGSALDITNVSDSVTFYLYSGSTLVDKETVPVVEDGADGQVSFTSFVFKRTNSKPSTPSGGSFLDPIPSGWDDTIPSGEEIAWMSKRIFTSDGEAPQENGWSDPIQMTDTADFDVDFCKTETYVTPTGHPNTASGWSNDGTDAIWMATSRKSNGVWTDWVVSKIKGEKGEDGDDGSNADAFEILPSVQYIKIDADGNRSVKSITVAVNYISGTNVTKVTSFNSSSSIYTHPQLCYQIDGGTITETNIGKSIDVSKAQSVVKIILYQYYGFSSLKFVRTEKEIQVVSDGTNGTDGENGVTASFYRITPSHLPLRQSRTGTISPQSFAVTCQKVEGSAVSDATPTKWSVEGSTDGSSWTTYSSSNYSTSGATLTVKSISTSYTFYRIGAYIGSSWVYAYASMSIDGSNGDDGDGIESIVEKYATSTSGTTAPADSEFKTTIPTLNKGYYLWNQEVITYTISGEVKGDKKVIGYAGENGTDGKGITKVEEYYLASSKSSGVTNATSGFTTDLQSVSESAPYLWNYSKITYTDNTTTSSTAVIIGMWVKGDTGSMPRYCGTYDSSTYYTYDANYRDIVVYGGSAWIVKTYNTSKKGQTPSSSSSFWEAATSFSFVAMDTALIDGANIAGFAFKDNKMMSRDTNGNLILDGKNGTLVANDITANGTFVSGTSGGQRAELSSNDLVIFDADGNECNRFTGTSIGTSAIPSSSSVSISLTTAADKTSGSTAAKTNLTSTFTVKSSGVIKITYSDLKVSVTYTQPSSGLKAFCTGTVTLYLCEMTGSSSSASISSKKVIVDAAVQGDGTSGTNTSGTGSGTKYMQVESGYYRIYAFITATPGTTTSLTTTGYWNLTAVEFTQDVFRSIHFKQGIVLSQTTKDYVAMMTDGSNMIFEAMSNGVGIRARGGKLQMTRDGSTWGTMPMLLYKGYAKYDSANSKYELTINFAYNGKTTGGKVSYNSKNVGQVTITFPSSVFDEDSTIVHAIGAKNLGNNDSSKGAFYVTLWGITESTLTFSVSDDETLNNGSFMFDIWQI
jgi:hypothetical protein